MKKLLALMLTFGLVCTLTLGTVGCKTETKKEVKKETTTKEETKDGKTVKEEVKKSESKTETDPKK